MTLGFVVRPEAEGDILRAFRWYEDRETGLGRQFLEEVEAEFERIRERPLEASLVYRGTRRVLVRRFPDSVFYAVNEVRIRVLAVSHHAQDPSTWKGRT